MRVFVSALYNTPFVLDFYYGILSRNCDESLILDREINERYEFIVKVIDRANHEVSGFKTTPITLEW